LINAPAEHGMPVTDLQLGRHESRRGSMLCLQLTGTSWPEDTHAHCPGRAAHLATDDDGTPPPGTAAWTPDGNGHVQLTAPIPGISSATGSPGQVTDEDEAERRTLIAPQQGNAHVTQERIRIGHHRQVLVEHGPIHRPGRQPHWKRTHTHHSDLVTGT
jgi:hypothetical protein